MIEHTDLLNTLAQIAVGILGFTGVVIALKHDTEEWTDMEKISFQALVTTTLTALIGALLPQVFAVIMNEPKAIWGAANIGIGLLHLANFISILLTVRKSKLDGASSNIKGLIDSLLGLVLILFHFLAGFGLTPWLEFILIVGVIQQLYIGTGNFLSLVRWG